MSYRRVLFVGFLLALASLACTVGGSPTSVAPTSAPAAASKTPVNFHNGGVTPEDVTEQATVEGQPTDEPPTDEQATAAPTKAPKPTATKAAKPTATKAAKPTATEATSNTSCDTLAANGDVYWLTFDNKNNATTVDSYAEGATEINPAFDYDCNPKTVQVSSVWSFNGQTIFTSKNNLDASDTSGTFVDGLKKNDDSAMETGDYGVSFFNAKTLIASGKVTLGGSGNGNGGQTGDTVNVNGTIVAKAGGKPIKGASFVVLNAGITIAQFVKDKQPQSELFTGAVTDSTGAFTLPDPLKRNTEYSFFVVADGFQDLTGDGFVINDTDPDPLSLNVTMVK